VIRFETTQTIERSAEEVWAYAADILRHPEWMGVTSARLLDGVGTEVGARAVERIKLGPRSVEVGLKVSKSIPARQIAWRVAGGSPVAGDVTLDLERLGPDRTRAVWSGWVGLTGLWRLLEPLMAGEVKAGEAAELRRLKDKLETSSTVTTATS
jgi:uncharacterized membrane protein